MQERDIPLACFHFDCFWMKGFQWYIQNSSVNNWT